jgi:acid phosphatase
VLAAMLAMLCGCGGGGPTSDPQSTGRVVRGAPAGVPRPNHVVVVVFENKSADQVVGNRNAPFLTSLARTGAYFVRAHGIAHPSQPNYLAMFSGSAHGVFSDACPENFGSAPNLAAQLQSSGRSFVGYAEGLPAPSYRGCQRGDYARKHAPWTDFAGLRPHTSEPFSTFPHRLSRLPTVSFVVPNLCHDMHDCSVAVGDAWARAHLRPYVAWARAHNSLLVITFDEDDGTAANHIATVLVGPMVRQGRYRQFINHYNVLRTLEDMYRLPPLGLARRAKPLSCWRAG